MSDWPESVPVLSEDDIYKGKLNGPDNMHCLVGWRDVTFRCHKCRIESSSELYDVIGTLSMAGFNDSHTKAESAKVWNQAMANLGYTEGNPESPTTGGK